MLHANPLQRPGLVEGKHRFRLINNIKCGMAHTRIMPVPERAAIETRRRCLTFRQ